MIFYDVSTPCVSTCYLACVGGDADLNKAVLVVEAPTPVMNFALEHKASSFLLANAAD